MAAVEPRCKLESSAMDVLRNRGWEVVDARRAGIDLDLEVFVPDRWLTVDLEGPEAELAKLPRGPREDRRPGVVRWTFTGDELDAGKAAECFHRAAAAWRASASPYR